MSLGTCFMCNYYDVCGGRVRVENFVSFWSDMCKSLESESEMIFSIPLVFLIMGMSCY